jgi:cysteine desulfurase
MFQLLHDERFTVKVTRNVFGKSKMGFQKIQMTRPIRLDEYNWCKFVPYHGRGAMLKLPIYLDNNSTTPCDPRVLEEMLPYFSQRFGNAASRTHAFGWEAEAAVELARERVAWMIGAEPSEIVFTSGATESSNLALKGVYEAQGLKSGHIITVETEHKAVLDSCKHLEKFGAKVTYLPVNPDGRISVEKLEEAITKETVLISVMYANNETGVLQPVAEIGAMAKKHRILFFSDGAQAAGKIPLDVNREGIDLLSLSAHKIYGPKGVGALYVRRKNPRVRLVAQQDGGGHERGLRSGTVNVPGVVGFGRASELISEDLDREQRRILPLRNRLEQGLLRIEGSSLNGSPNHRLPHVTNLSFRFVDGASLISSLSKDLALSSGSACTSAVAEPSYVLKAMGVEPEVARASLRFGLGRFTSEEEIDFALERVQKVVEKAREKSPFWPLG